MDNILFILIGLVLGGLGMLWGYTFFRRKQNKEIAKSQSVVLLEKLKKVCKLVVVEGEFAEIYDHQHKKGYFFNLFSSEKKALLIVNAKVHVGFDLQKVKLEANTEQKKIFIKEFPQPEVLSFEPDFKVYDLKDGFLNKFSAEELTALNKEAKQFILDKVPNTGLMATAQKEALQAIQLMESITETIGWRLDYKALEIKNEKLTMKN